jgi:cytochrome oxidase assembly protein ShyY1
MTDSLEYRRAVAVGLYDPDREVIEVGRAVNGVPAIYLVLPLRLDDGRAVLVEAGWIPSPDARIFRSPAVTADDTVEVHGVLLAPRTGVIPENVEWPISVRFADPTVLGPLFPYPLHAWILRRTDRLPDVNSLHVIPLPELTQGPHLSYAVQWFVFAAIAVVGVIALLMVEAKDARRSPGDSDRAY